MKRETFHDHPDPYRRGERLIPENQTDRAIIHALLKPKFDGWRWDFVDEASHDGPKRLSITVGCDTADRWDDGGCFRAYLHADPTDQQDNPVMSQMDQFQGVIWLWVESRHRSGYDELQFLWSLGERIYPQGPTIDGQSNLWPYPPVIHSSSIYPST